MAHPRGVEPHRKRRGKPYFFEIEQGQKGLNPGPARTKARTKMKKTSNTEQKSHVLAPFLNMIYPSLYGKFGATVLVYLVALVGRIRITTILAKLAGEMGGYFSSKEFDKMFMNQVRFGLWCMLATTWTQSMSYLEKLVGVQVREIVYGHFHSKYFDKNALSMYKNNLVDTASRLTTDVKKFFLRINSIQSSIHSFFIVGEFAIKTTSTYKSIGLRVGWGEWVGR